MFHSRKSRESRSIDSGALAAASAIGKALDASGTKVNAERLPRYNSFSRSNSMIRTTSMSSRSGSLRSNKNGARSSSLQLGTSRNKNRESIIDESEFFDAEDTFHAFGGAPAPSRRATMKKYVPGPNGLVAVEVPIIENAHQKKRGSKIRRSTSMTSGMQVRNNSLGRKSSSGSLTSNSSQKGGQVRRTSMETQKRHTIDVQKGTKPLVEQFVKEETDEQLEEEKKEAIKPIVIPPSPGKQDTTFKRFGRNEDVIEKQHEVNELLEKAVGIENEIITEEQELQTQSAPVVLINPPEQEFKEEKSKPVSQGTDSKTPDDINAMESVSEKTTAVPGDVDISPELASTEIPAIEVITDDTTPVEDLSGTANDSVKSGEINANNSETTTSTKSELSMPGISKPNVAKEQGGKIDKKLNSGSSMAQYIRSANQYLNKGHENVTNAHSKESLPANDIPELGTKKEQVAKPAPLQKVPSPMKSALKKTNSRTSTSSHYNDRGNSKANEAYLSLATAENTRLNAQLTGDPPSRRSSVRKARPTSMMTQNITDNGGPGQPRTKHLSMQPSMQQMQPPARSKKRPDTSRVVAGSGEATSRKSSKHSQSTDNILYPKESPAKRSSFEKQRPQQSHLGFKKLSLREDVTDIMYEQSSLNNRFHGNDPQTPTKKQEPPPQTSQQALQSISGGAWKSRFHDSDSEEEGGPFSSGGSGSTQPSSTGGAFLFKSKHSDVKLAPPQPHFSQGSSSAPASKHSTPNKKISQMSLRTSSSVSELGPPKASNKVTSRYFSETLPTPQPISEPKKKNGFGKKLKKIFGRKK
ncbi:LAFE_0F07448g1_1 [Lachancea fermentati]|uniref:LAFE_0F07448g1_1 n=1 Tax=Lachancea fermentati TaxID=4955 RepID=A0A1G4MF47_LACFM|nr:LAFE_0F07448g1_1 [Lachancea fermentati]